LKGESEMNRFIACFFALLLLVLLPSCDANYSDDVVSTTTDEVTALLNTEVQTTMERTLLTSETTEYTYPQNTPSSVKKNAETFFREIDISREAALWSAELLDQVGIKRIEEMHVENSEEGFIHAIIMDSDNDKFFLSLGRNGYIGGIRKDDINGDFVWMPIY